MDPSSARAMECAAKSPLGGVFEIMSLLHLQEHRSVSLLDTTPELPADRCIERVGGGRCRKTVSKVALTQYCWKHQKKNSLSHPSDKILCHWNSKKLFQKGTSGFSLV